MISDLLELADAEQQLEAATEELSAATYRMDTAPSDDSRAAWHGARALHAHLTERAEGLRAKQEQARQVLADRVALEATSAKQNKQRVAELNTSRDAIVAAISRAQDALLELVDVAAGHNTLVKRHVDEVAEQGLSYIEGRPYGADQTGGFVVLDGESWLAVDGHSLLHQTAERVRASRFYVDGGQVAVSRLARRNAAAMRAAAILNRVAPPEQVDIPNWQQTLAARTPVSGARVRAGTLAS